MSAERLQKVLASAGIASRRDCEALIAAGRVSVNGRVVQEPGMRVDLAQDLVLVDGNPVRPPSSRTYVMLHKPVGFVSTVDDPHGRPTVLELVATTARVFPVGRLDVDSEGLILLTDDGELTHHLTHPKFEVEKEYRVLLDRPLDADALREWRNGILLDDEMTAPAKVVLAETSAEGVWYSVVLREGRKRQIRATARLLGYEVHRLIRVREGDLLLGDLPVRESRPLTDDEVARLRTHITTRPPREARERPGPGRTGAAMGAAAATGAATGAVRRRDDERDDRPRDDRPRSDRPAYGRDDRPRDDRPRGDRPAYGRDDRPRDDRPRGDRPAYGRDDRPRDDRPRGERPAYGRDDRPRDDRPRGERPAYGRDERPRDDRPRGERPAYGRDERPRDDRPGWV
ncbi:MAG: pseudouridine synthase, partial [Oscillochloridaceae bacterium umkhey_bin13]